MEQAELQTLELKGVNPNPWSVTGINHQLTQRQLKLMVVHPVRATCVSKYHYLKGTISQSADRSLLKVSYLGSEGTASLDFRRSTASSSIGRINCRAHYCKQDVVCLYQSLVWDTLPRRSFRLYWSTPSEITLAYLVKPKSSPNNLQLPVTSWQHSHAHAL